MKLVLKFKNGPLDSLDINVYGSDYNEMLKVADRLWSGDFDMDIVNDPTPIEWKRGVHP
jgi:hypothetical protein